MRKECSENNNKYNSIVWGKSEASKKSQALLQKTNSEFENENPDFAFDFSNFLSNHL